MKLLEQNKQHILDHLMIYNKFIDKDDYYEYPFEMTQEGICKDLGWGRTKLSNILGRLENEGNIECRHVRIKGKKKKYIIPMLTSKGYNTAKLISSEQLQNHDLSQMGLTSSSQEV
jgi:hypothetical protein